MLAFFLGVIGHSRSVGGSIVGFGGVGVDCFCVSLLAVCSELLLEGVEQFFIALFGAFFC